MKKNTYQKGIFLGCIICFMSTLASAQVNYKIHSLFVYKFTQYIEWPSKSVEFVIGIVGNSPIQEELEALAAIKKVDTRSIVIKKISPTADLSGCNMVFIAQNQSSHLPAISGKLQGKPILIISETNDGATKGAGINFIIVDDKMKFELNKGSVEKKGLKVSGDLAKLAVMVG